MFERFHESAKESLFIAYRAVQDRGGIFIEPEDVVLGLLQVPSVTIARFAVTSHPADVVRARLEAVLLSGSTVQESPDIPFSEATKRVLEQARSEAYSLNDSVIRPEHLLLGVLVSTSGAAAEALKEVGLEAGVIRRSLHSPAH